MIIKEQPLVIDQRFIVQRLLGAVHEEFFPGARSSCRFPRIVGNSSKLACASACLEIAKMAPSR